MATAVAIIFFYSRESPGNCVYFLIYLGLVILSYYMFIHTHSLFLYMFSLIYMYKIYIAI